MKSNILAIFLLGTVLLSVEAMISPEAEAAEAKKRPPVTTKTLPEGARATTKTGAGTGTPLWQQRIVVSIKTGERTTIADVMAQKTAATTSVNGMPAPGGGYYYTPGPANRPASSSTGGVAAGTSTSGSNGLGFINQDMMGGSMVLLSGASIFQPLANMSFGSGGDSGVCLECAERGATTAPTSDPNLSTTNENTIPDEIRPGYELLVPIFNEIGEFPFTTGDTYNANYFAALYDVLMREPFSELSDLARDEMLGHCPNYPNLNDLQKKAMVMLMFSHLMRSQNGNFEPRRIINNAGDTSNRGHGLCGIQPDFARERLLHEYQNVIENQSIYQVSAAQASRSSYALQDFGMSFNSLEDLYEPQNNIRFCVMELHYTAVIQAQNSSGLVHPFEHKMTFLGSSEIRGKFRNYALCRPANTGEEAPPQTSGGVIESN